MSIAWVPRIGSDFAGYHLESLVGSGGMSIVYRAEHLGLGRTVALKLLSPQLSEDESFRERFIRESRLAASLDHPNIIPIYEAGEEDGVFFIAMRFVEGHDLKTVIKRERQLGAERAASLVTQVASALSAAHAKDLVHRDIKPANILIASGQGAEESDHAYLSDFGVAKLSSSKVLTKTGMFVGTADYAAPEQIEGKQLDGRADVYALGCVLYECLTGAPAYEKDSEVALIYAHLLEPPPSVLKERPDLPPEIDQVVAKAMAKSRDERYASARELSTAIRQVLLGDGAHPVTAGTGVPQATILASPGAVTAAQTGGGPLTGAETGAQTGAPTGAQTGAPVAATGEGIAPPGAPVPPMTGEEPVPPTGGRSGPPWKLLFIALLVATLVAAGAVLAYLLVGGDDPQTAATGTTQGQPGPPAGDSAPKSLLEVLVPTQIARTCTTSSTPSGDAVETNECTPAEGASVSDANEYSLSFYKDADALEQAYGEQKSAAEIGSCGSTAGERVWIHPTTSGRGGRRFCYVDQSGNFVIVWTHEKLGADDHVDMLGVALEPGRSPRTFRSWWDAINDDVGKCRPAISEEACLDTIQRITG